MNRSPIRVLLKISGEALGGENGVGFDSGELRRISGEIAAAVVQNVEVAVVVGGGNFLRGSELTPLGIERSMADRMGMLATLINGMALASSLESQGQAAQVLSAVEVGSFVEGFRLSRCDECLREGIVVILAGGTGLPYFTTDTTASLRAVEIGASVLLKGTRVDGVYSEDPEKNPRAQLFDAIDYEEVLRRDLRVMDATAIALCMEHRMPIRVFNMQREGNIRRSLLLEEVGTLVK